jgi:hypothetical protein
MYQYIFVMKETCKVDGLILLKLCVYFYHMDLYMLTVSLGCSMMSYYL